MDLIARLDGLLDEVEAAREELLQGVKRVQATIGAAILGPKKRMQYLFTFDFDGVLTNPEVKLALFDPIGNKMVVSSRDNTPENLAEVREVVGPDCEVILCGGFVEKCTTLAELSGKFSVIHFEDDPAVARFMKYTDLDIEVKMV